MKQDEKAALENEGCAALAIWLEIAYQETVEETEVACLEEDQDVQSASSPIYPGWPPAEPPWHECAWHRFQVPLSNDHGKQDEN